MELLYADDLVLIAETKELLLEKMRKWKEGMEKKGLRVNAGKTKVMWCQVNKGQAEDSALASCSSQNKFQDCYYRFQGIAFPTAILSCRPCPTVCAHVITAIFFLVNMYSFTKNCNGKVQVFLIRCLGHLE